MKGKGRLKDDIEILSLINCKYTTLQIEKIASSCWLEEPVENFYEFLRVYVPQTEDMPGSNISTDWGKCFPEWQFADSFIHLELRREVKKITCKWENVRQGNIYDWIWGMKK